MELLIAELSPLNAQSPDPEQLQMPNSCNSLLRVCSIMYVLNSTTACESLLNFPSFGVWKFHTLFCLEISIHCNVFSNSYRQGVLQPKEMSHTTTLAASLCCARSTQLDYPLTGISIFHIGVQLFPESSLKISKVCSSIILQVFENNFVYCYRTDFFSDYISI